ncbi:Hypothetical protein D9617_16g014300 [Elsinoe fawcettii]|nr:Hypothetical protein D9617_16g014300 [Elsinoe fawcettii]
MMRDNGHSHLASQATAIWETTYVVTLKLATKRGSSFLSGVAAKLFLAASQEAPDIVFRDLSKRDAAEATICDLMQLARSPLFSQVSHALRQDLVADFLSWLSSISGQVQLVQALIQQDRVNRTSKSRTPGPSPISSLQKHLDVFLASAYQAEDIVESKDIAADADDYANDLNDQLYRMLHDPDVCTCRSSSDGKNNHRGCLRLRTAPILQDDKVIFDVIFSGSSRSKGNDIIQWQQLRLLIPRRQNRGRKRVTMAISPTENDSASSARQDSARGSAEVRKFCDLLNESSGSVLICVEIRNQQFFKLDDHEEGQRETVSHLEHDLCSSVESMINDDLAQGSNVLRHDKTWPYFESSFQQQSVKDTYREVTRRCLDRNFFKTYSRGDRVKGNPRRRQQAKSASDTTVEERRDMIYELVVSPLKELLVATGWDKCLTEIEPMVMKSSTGPETYQDDTLTTTSRTSVPAALLGKAASGTSGNAWIDRIKHYNGALTQQHLHDMSAHKPTHDRIRVAILDTGYDPYCTAFINRDRRKRLARGRWKDFVDDSSVPVDEHGHGTRVQSLVMQLAPSVDVYVARIAKHSEDLEIAHEAIAKAITWASDECRVDIISMSFGFDDETYDHHGNPIRQAIYNAMSARAGDNILFFAAAGNDGANNGKMMFPAKHELVVPIYGTGPTGAFMDDLNPIARRDDPSVFGTLADKVPCSGLEDEGEVTETGTSFATAIAAGYAGMLLDYIRIMERKRQENFGEVMAWSKRLGTRRGMATLFSTISESQSERRYYLYPSGFFSKPEEARIADIAKAYHDAR